MVKVKPPKLDPVQRAIVMRERGIKRLELRKVEIRRDAEAECADIDRLIATRRVVLDAIKKGTLKP